MSFPRVRLTINPAEHALLKPGLDVIACQLAGAKLGLRTARHTLERTNPEICNIYKRKQYSVEGDQAVINIRAKLWDLTSSRKIRASFLELAAAALALRLLKRLPDSTHDPIPAKALESKLERYRKQAKGAAISRLGKEQYAAAADRWLCFVQWVRYYQVHLQQPKPFSRWRRNTWACQRSALADLIADILSDFGYAPLSELDMKRAVRLIKEELRRGRHPVTLMELLRSTDPADRQFLFHIVAKKCELMPLPGVRYPYDVAASMRAERFKNKNIHRMPAAIEAPTAPADSVLERQNQTSPQTAGQSFRGLNLTEAVANWFREHVDRDHWRAVGNLALRIVTFTPPSQLTVPPAASLTELISKTRPVNLTGTPCYPDHGRTLASWLLTWLYRCNSYHDGVIMALRSGYRLATEDRETQAA